MKKGDMETERNGMRVGERWREIERIKKLKKEGIVRQWRKMWEGGREGECVLAKRKKKIVEKDSFKMEPSGKR